MEQIRLGLKENVNITPFTESDMYMVYSTGITPFNAKQMEQIRLGLIDSLDVSFYTDPNNDPFRMSILRQILKMTKGKLHNGWFQEYNVFLESNGKKYPLYSNERLLQILFGIIEGIDYSKYDSITYSVEQMEIIRTGLNQGLDVTEYSNPNLTPKEMRDKQKKILAESKTAKENNNKLVKELKPNKRRK